MKVLPCFVTILCALSVAARKHARYVYEIQTRFMKENILSSPPTDEPTGSLSPTDAGSYKFDVSVVPTSPSISPTQKNTELPTSVTLMTLESPSVSTEPYPKPKKGTPTLVVQWSILLPLVSLGLMVWAAGKNREYLCCSSAAFDMVPGEIVVTKHVDNTSVADDDATDIELVPVETFESWAGMDESCEDNRTGYVRME